VTKQVCEAGNLALKEAVAKGYTAERDGFSRPDNSSTYKAELFRVVPFATASKSLTYIPQVADTIWREFRCQSGGRNAPPVRRVARPTDAANPLVVCNCIKSGIET
jgi:hypothetical protein